MMKARRHNSYESIFPSKGKNIATLFFQKFNDSFQDSVILLKFSMENICTISNYL